MITRWRRRRAVDAAVEEANEKMRDALCAIHADAPRLRQAVDDLISAIDNLDAGHPPSLLDHDERRRDPS